MASAMDLDAVPPDGSQAPPQGGASTLTWPPQPAAQARPSPLDQAAATRQQSRSYYDLSSAQIADDGDMVGKPEGVKQGALKDFAGEVWASSVQVGQGLLGTASLVARQLGSDPSTVAYIEQQKQGVADYAEKVIDGLSPDAKAAMHSSIFGGEGVATPSDVGWGKYAAATVAGVIPQIALAVLPGGIISTAMRRLLMSAGAATTVVTGAGAVAGAAGTAATFGALDAGEGYNALVDAVDKAKPEELMRSPVYSALRQQGLSDEDARKQLVGQIAPAFAAKRFATGAAAGSGLGALATRGALGAGAAGLARRAAVGAMEGAGVMGGQAGIDTHLQQQAGVAAGTQEAYDPSETAKAVASGALGGAVFGAAGGAVHKRPARVPKPDAIAPGDVAPDHAAAMAEALGPAPEPQQTEMFNPYQMGAGPKPGDIEGMPHTQPDMLGGASTMVPRGEPPLPPTPASSVPMTGDPRPVPPPGPTQGAMFQDLPEQRQGQPTPQPASPPAEPAAQGEMPFPLGVRNPAPATPVPATTPEPKSDIVAQVRQLVNKRNPRDTVFVASGNEGSVPTKLGVGIIRVQRPEGTLLTTSPAKADAFRSTPQLTDEMMAGLLGLPENKGQVLASGQQPVVVQGRDGQGNVVAESAASPAGVPAAVKAARAITPVEGSVGTTTPEAVQARRAALTAPAVQEVPSGSSGIRQSEAAPPPVAAASPVAVAPVGDAVPKPPARAPKVKAVAPAESEGAAFVPASKPEVKPTAPPGQTVKEAAATTVAPKSPAQAEAGTYRKGKVDIGGLKVAIETAKGDVRRGVGPNGEAWEVKVPAHYGYFHGTEGADGDHVDVHLGPRAEHARKAYFSGEQAEDHPVYVVDQVDPKTRMFDEHKSMVGFASQEDAVRAYDRAYSDGSGPSRRGAVTEMPFDQFKSWVKEGDTKKALTYKSTRADELRAKRAAEKARMAETMAARTKPKAFAEAAPAEGADLAIRKGEAKVPEKPKPAAHVEDDEHEGAELVHEDEHAAAAADIEQEQSGDTRHEDDAREAGERSQAEMQLGETAPEHERSAATTDLERVGNDAIMSLMRDGMSGQEAVDAFGRQRRAGGRQRRWNTLKDFLDDKIETFDDPERRAEVLRKIEETTGNKRLSPEEKRANTLALKRDIDPTWIENLKDIRERIDGLTPDDEAAVARSSKASKTTESTTVAAAGRAFKAIENGPRAKDALRSLFKAEHYNADVNETEAIYRSNRVTREDVDKVEKALARLPEDVRERTTADLHDKYGPFAPTVLGRTRLAQELDFPRTGARVRLAIRMNEKEGRTTGLHSLLDAIASDSTVNDTAPHFTELAKVLRTIAPNLDVISHRQAVGRGFDAALSTSNGAYVSRTARSRAFIALELDSNTRQVESLLHEVTHAVTKDALDLAMDNRKTVGSGLVDALEAIHVELTDNAEGAMGDAHPFAVKYARSSPHEMLAMMMTNPEVQAVMARISPSAEFLGTMQRLGITTQPRTTLWQAFRSWVAHALGLDGQKASLLDYALTVGETALAAGQEHAGIRQQYHGVDIWNRKAGMIPRTDGTETLQVLQSQRDPVERAMADAADTKLHTRVLSRIDAPGIAESARRALLQGAPTDAIVKWNRDLYQPSDRLAIEGNPLVKFQGALEAISHVATSVHKQYADRVSGLTDRLAAAGPKLAQLMNDATIAEVRLGVSDPVANDHLKTPEERAALVSLQKRYEALPAEQKQLYTDTRQLYDEMYRQERKARVDALIRIASPDATAAQADEMRKALRTKAGTAELIDAADAHAVAASFGLAWPSRAPLVRAVARLHNMGFVQGDYFPLRRFGDYVVRYGSGAEGNYGVEMFEKLGEAQARRAELARAGTDDLSQVLSKRTSKLREIVPNHPIVRELEQAMERNPDLAPHAESVRDTVNSILLEHGTRSEAVRTAMRRKGVQGASTNTAQAMAREMLGLSYRLGDLAHGMDRSQALAEMRLVTDDLGRHGQDGDQRRAQAVLNEVEQRMPSGDNAAGALSNLTRRASTLGYVQSLMSPSHMLTSTIEVHMNSTALLGARHGVARASLSIGKALAEMAPKMASLGFQNTMAAMGRGLKASDWDLAHFARDRFIDKGADKTRMGELFAALDQAGLVDHTQSRELQRIANPARFTPTVVGKAWQRFMDINAAGAHAVDVMNRTAVAKAAYDLELAKTRDHAKAMAYAVQTVRDTGPNYNLANKARITTDRGVLGAFAAPITQFKQYGIFMYGLMSNLAKASMHNTPSEARTEARKALAGVLISHAAMAGGLTLIADPLRYGGMLYDYATGADKPHQYENDVRGWMSDTFGPELGEVLARGVPHLAGFDIHRRVGLANLLEVPELESFDGKGFAKVLATAMIGAAGEDAASIAGGIGKMMRGDLGGGAIDAAPRVARDVMKAMKLADKGAVTGRGSVLLPPEKISTGDVAWQAVGFQPSQVSEAREARFAIQEAQHEVQFQRENLAKQWLDADQSERAQIMTEIRVFNQAHPGSSITISQLMRRLVAQHAVAGTTVAPSYGVKIPAKSRNEFVPAGRFANVQ